MLYMVIVGMILQINLDVNMKKDLPICINGFVVTYLFAQTNMNVVNWIMFILAAASFLWCVKK